MQLHTDKILRSETQPCQHAKLQGHARGDPNMRYWSLDYQVEHRGELVCLACLLKSVE